MQVLQNFAKDTIEKYETNMEKMQFSVVLGDIMGTRIAYK